MSRDGYLPPGCTERDVDEAAPGYWEDEQRRRDTPETLLREIESAFDHLCHTGHFKEAKAKWHEIGIALRWMEKMDGTGK